MMISIDDDVLFTDVEPGVQYTVGTLEDLSGNPLASDAVLANADDRTGPAIWSAQTITVNTVEIILYEAVDDGTIVGGDFTFSGFATAGANNPSI